MPGHVRSVKAAPPVTLERFDGRGLRRVDCPHARALAAGTRARACYDSFVTWKRGGASPFLTGRARERAPQVIEYAAASGAAALVSPSGEIVLFAGSAVDVDLTRIARTARLLGAARTDVCFRAGEVCVQAAPVVHGWTLCVISIPPVAPSVTAERLHKAAHVLALALLDSVSPSGAGTPQGPAPAEAAVFASTAGRARRRS